MSSSATVLGTVQDGGLPQVGCRCANCRGAWNDPGLVRPVACLGLVDSRRGDAWLIDATPDLPAQWHALQELHPGCRLAGILLTHAHVGHYSGLLHLGREAWNTHGLAVWATCRMAGFLGGNQPWSRLVDQENIRLRELLPGQELRLTAALAVTPLAVPHRDELSDTMSFVIAGARRRLFYCPDIDAWGEWDHDLRGLIAGMDVALLDGTFFSAAELPGRDMSQVPHPLVLETVERLAGVRCDLRLVHLNHSNPLNYAGPEREWLEARGIRVAALGDQWEL